MFNLQKSCDYTLYKINVILIQNKRQSAYMMMMNFSFHPLSPT